MPAQSSSAVDEIVAEREDITFRGGAAHKWSIGQRHTMAIVALGALVLGMCIGGALNQRATLGATRYRRWGMYINT